MQKGGIIAPQILKKINDKRNLLEHEFKKPSLEQVEDALDVATLFISYASSLTKTPNLLYVERRRRVYYKLFFDKVEIKFVFIDSKERERFSIMEGDRSFNLLKKEALKYCIPILHF
ncbi:MAG: hypothetical protein U9O85_06905 [Euryarchaeota archaeon]|nr:hypothetical protein [Euryarchaeota archaeon]